MVESSEGSVHKTYERVWAGTFIGQAVVLVLHGLALLVIPADFAEMHDFNLNTDNQLMFLRLIGMTYLPLAFLSLLSWKVTSPDGRNTVLYFFVTFSVFELIAHIWMFAVGATNAEVIPAFFISGVFIGLDVYLISKRHW